MVALTTGYSGDYSSGGIIMTKLRTIIGAVAVCLMAGTAFAGEGKPYVGVSAVVAIMSDSTLTDSTGASLKLSYNPGFALSGVAGYEFGNGLRLEGEANYRQASMDKVYVAGLTGNISSDVWSVGMMANAYFDIKNSSPVTPYFGGGIGFANVNVGDGTINGIRVWSKADDTVFAYQVAVGAGFDVTKELTLDLGYKYYGTQDPKFGLAKADYSSHNLMVGLRYRF